jgi:hypothetical protein
VSTYAVNHHEVTLVQLSFDFYMLEARPDYGIGDRTYDSNNLDAELSEEGIQSISPHGKKKKRKAQDDRQSRRYARCWLVERLFSWLQWKRRLLTRWEHYSENFVTASNRRHSGTGIGTGIAAKKIRLAMMRPDGSMPNPDQSDRPGQRQYSADPAQPRVFHIQQLCHDLLPRIRHHEEDQPFQYRDQAQRR